MAYPTNPIYKFYKDLITKENCGLLKLDGNIQKSIPLEEANTDYQEYLEWAKTNTAEASD